MTALVVYHRPTTFGHPHPGKIAYRRTQDRDVIEVDELHRAIPGKSVRHLGLIRRVLAVGYEGWRPVVHLIRT